ncbi:hypothetical protein ANCDUO_05069 [Ancylostoma duodenale]|uniref:Uncharacterized protein n=1 Tax=Ancylostoma duodenale TaxID=51022 RepID=A0A0C2DPL4_9BILA|nr:hypothetical protein ANCDUO_05069 [Ancylostoma duodenale]
MSPMLDDNRKAMVKPDLSGLIDRKMVASISRLALTPGAPLSEPVFDQSGPPRKHGTSTAAMCSTRIIVDITLKSLMMSAPIQTVKLIPMRSYQTPDTVSVDLIGLQLPRPEEDRMKRSAAWRSHQQLTQVLKITVIPPRGARHRVLCRSSNESIFSETIYYADPHTQDITAERSEQSAGEERQDSDAEGWRAVESQQPQEQQRHPGQPYDPRRAQVEEQRRAQQEERRRAQEEAQRRAQEEEQRRAHEEERRRALHQAQLDRSRQME